MPAGIQGVSCVNCRKPLDLATYQDHFVHALSKDAQWIELDQFGSVGGSLPEYCGAAVGRHVPMGDVPDLSDPAAVAAWLNIEVD